MAAMGFASTVKWAARRRHRFLRPARVAPGLLWAEGFAWEDLVVLPPGSRQVVRATISFLCYFLHAGSDNQIVATCVKLFDTMAQMTGRQLNWADPLGEYVGRGSQGVANDKGGKKASKVLSFRRSRRPKLELPKKKLLLVYNADATGAAAARALQVSMEISPPLTHPSALALIHEPISTFRNEGAP